MAALAFHLAHGCARIMEPLLCFLGGPSPRSPAVDAAAVSLLVVLPTAYLAFVIVAHFAGVAHLPAPAPAAGVGRFAAMVFTLVSAWLLVFAGLLASFFFFIAAGKQGTGSGLSSRTMLS